MWGYISGAERCVVWCEGLKIFVDMWHNDFAEIGGYISDGVCFWRDNMGLK